MVTVNIQTTTPNYDDAPYLGDSESGTEIIRDYINWDDVVDVYIDNTNSYDGLYLWYGICSLTGELYDGAETTIWNGTFGHLPEFTRESWQSVLNREEREYYPFIRIISQGERELPYSTMVNFSPYYMEGEEEPEPEEPQDSNMVKVYKDTLTSLGDAIRNAKGEEKNVYYSIDFDRDEIPIVEIDGTEYYKVYLDEILSDIYSHNIWYEFDWINFDKEIQIKYQLQENYYPNLYYFDSSGEYQGHHKIYIGGYIEELQLNDFLESEEYKNYIYIKKIWTHSNYKITTDKAVDYNPEVMYTPAEMVDQVYLLSQLSLSPNELMLTGDCSRKFTGGWEWFFEKYNSYITTNDITVASEMFAYLSNTTSIPFQINFKEGFEINIDGLFRDCRNLQSLPEINNFTVRNISNLFLGCHHLSRIPEDYFDNWDFSPLHSNIQIEMYNIFDNCNSLKNIPQSFIDNLYSGFYDFSNFSLFTPYYGTFRGCYVLNNVNNLKVCSILDDNAFVDFLNDCYRLKSFTFEPNQTAQWQNQIIDLSRNIGYCPYNPYITGNQDYHGIGNETKITNDSSYEELRDVRDAWTDRVPYSRYNHDSAVETINSLPDTSAYGTNTIIFLGASGSSTWKYETEEGRVGGGAINTLTEAEIAVASAKGWTVSLV